MQTITVRTLTTSNNNSSIRTIMSSNPNEIISFPRHLHSRFPVTCKLQSTELIYNLLHSNDDDDNNNNNIGQYQSLTH